MEKFKSPARAVRKCQKTAAESFYKKHCGNVMFRDEIDKIPKAIVKGFFKPEMEYLTSVVQPGSRIIDVGCGDGRVLDYLQCKASSITGIDCSQEQCDKARKNLPAATIVVASALILPFNDSSFEHVLCTFNTFGNFGKNKASLLNELARIAVAGGEVIITVYSKAALQYQFELYRNFGFEVVSFDDKKVVLREGLISERFSSEEIRAIGKEAGMTAEITPLSEIAYAFRFTKR